MNIFFNAIGLLLLGCSACFAAPDSTALAAPALFSEAERAQNVAFWNEPDRYQIGPREGARTGGVFVARLTPEASIWFSAYNRALRTGLTPAQNAIPFPTPIAPATRWESWVAAKLKFDRAFAAQQANAANAELLEAPRALLRITPAAGALAGSPTASEQPENSPEAPKFRATLPELTSPRLAPNVETTAPPTLPAQPPIAPQKTAIPVRLPPHPGPIPADLLAIAGNAPPFAACVAPLRHTVSFESGEVFALTDHILLSSSRNPSFRFAQGVMSVGTPLSSLAPDELARIFAAAGLTESQGRVMRAVSALEGGFDSINTYDTGFVSVGFIQFAALERGNGSLGALLRFEKTRNPLDFARDFHDFGVEVSEDGTLAVLDPSSGAELSGNAAVQKIIDDKRLIAVFQIAGRRSVAFRAAQIQIAKTGYYPADSPIEVNIGGQVSRGRASDVVPSEAGLATLFDRKVNVGNIRLLNSVLRNLMLKHGLTRFEEVAPFERELIGALKWRRDFLKDASLSQPL